MKIKPPPPGLEPRPLGFDSLPRRGESQAAMDRRLVGEAKSHLQQLLRDPDYFEAMLWLDAEGGVRVPPRVRVRRTAMGVMARKLQGGREPPTLRKRKSSAPAALLRAIDRGLLQPALGLPRSASIAEVARAIADLEHPHRRLGLRDEKAEKLASRLRAEKSWEKKKRTR